MQTKENEVTVVVQQILDQVRRAVVGKDEVLLWVLAAILARGHILLEDIPGVGKTTMALAFSKALDLSYSRIQFTPDVLPSDITGYSIPDAQTGGLRYQPGAVLTNLFLADELNRTSSRTQAALLEAMEERQVTVDGHSYQLENPFSVIATQNPVGASGTQLLPDSQTDRFTVRISMGYPNFEAECQMLINRSRQNPLDKVKQAVTVEELINMQNNVKEVFVSEDMAKYIVMLVTATRQNSLFERGASPRAALSLKDMAKAAAFADDRDYIVPRDIQNIFVATISHRVILSAEANAKKISVTKALNEILRTTRQPKI